MSNYWIASREESLIYSERMLVELIDRLDESIGAGAPVATLRAQLCVIREQVEAVETAIQQAQTRIKELETKLQGQKLAPYQDRLEETAEKMLQLVFRSRNAAASLQHMASTLGLSKQVAHYHAVELHKRKMIVFDGDVCQITHEGSGYIIRNKLE